MQGDMITIEEARDKLGITLAAVRSYVRTRLVRGGGGMVSLEDVAAAHEAARSIGSVADLVREVAVLKAESRRQHQLIQLLLHAAGIQQSARDYTDDELRGLLAMARAGVGEFCRRGVSPRRLRDLADSTLAIDDRTLRRVDHIAGAKSAWIPMVHLLEDLDDAMEGRADLALDEGMRHARMMLNLARQHLATQAKFVLALQHPLRDPKKLLSDLCLRAANLNLVENRPVDLGVILSNLIGATTSALPTGRCPDGR